MTALFDFADVRVTAPRGDGVEAVILDAITAEVGERGITCVLGPSGAGKSTLLRLCNRLEVPTAGTVRFRGRDVAELDPLALRREVGMVFQRPTLFGGTVRDNLAVARPDGDETAFVGALERARLGASFLDRPADELSGGEAQRACLARTLVTGPQVLLMDEPTSALDPASRRGLEDLARSLADEGVPMLWVTHDLAQADRLADDVLVLIGGRLVLHADMAAVHGSTDPAIVAFRAAGADEDATDDGTVRDGSDRDRHEEAAGG